MKNSPDALHAGARGVMTAGRHELTNGRFGTHAKTRPSSKKISESALRG
jgi:hypothetical protein